MTIPHGGRDEKTSERGTDQTLALDRSTGIKNVLVQRSGVDPERVFILDPDGQGEWKDEMIRMELKLSD